MATIYEKGFLFKKETTKGTDSVPTNLLNGVRIEKDFAVTPTAEKIPYKPVKLTMGGLKSLTGRKTITLTVPTLVRGSGTAGTAPEIGDLLQACGLSETISAGTSVTYAPLSTGLVSGTGYAYIDGLLCKALGAVADTSIECTIGEPIKATFNVQAGFDVAPTAVACPTITQDAVQPIVMTSADVVSDGTTLKVGAFTLALGNEMGDHYNTGENTYTVADRNATITITKDSVSTVADWNALVAGTEFAITSTFGTVAGNKMQLNAPKAVMTAESMAERNERTTKELTFELVETAGDDQFSVVFL